MEEWVLYKCVRCLETFVVPPDTDCDVCGCPHVLEVHVGSPGSESTRPPMTTDGHLTARAPQWWIFRQGPHGRKL